MGIVYFGLSESDFKGFEKVEGSYIDQEKIAKAYVIDAQTRAQDWNSLADKLVCDEL